MNRIFALIFLTSVLTSCGIIGGESRVDIDPGDIVITTDKNMYIAVKDLEEELPTYEFQLISEFENRSGRTLYLAICGPSSVKPIYHLELTSRDESELSGYDPFYACSGHFDPIIIESGETRTDTFQVKGPTAWQSGTNEPIGVLDGNFRLVYDALTCARGEACEVPDSLAWSNEFEVSLLE